MSEDILERKPKRKREAMPDRLKECRKDMPNRTPGSRRYARKNSRMPEKRPERMSEDMPDRT